MKTALFSSTELTNRLGFRDMCSLEEVVDAYPLLDVVDHDHRKKLVTANSTASIQSPITLTVYEIFDPSLYFASSLMIFVCFLADRTLVKIELLN